MTPLWIDTDMGFDDMLAIMMVQQSKRRIDGCSLIFGNTTLAQVHQHAADMAAFWDWRFPIHDGAATPLSGTVITAESVLGPSGLPTPARTLPAGRSLPERSPALAALTHWLEEASTAVEILALGPLTNIAVLCRERPDLLATLKCVTWMGGGASTGNHTAAAEFNAFADPQAAAIVCASGVPIKMLDLDICRQVTMNPTDTAALRSIDTEKANVLHDLLGGFIQVALSKGRSSQPIFDVVAAACIVDPVTVTFSPINLQIDVSDGAQRGRTIVQFGTGNHCNAQIGSHADVAQIRQMATDVLLKAARL